MGFISRRVIPRKVRRAAHPVRAIKRAATPRAIKRVRRAMSPLSNAKYRLARWLTTSQTRPRRSPSILDVIASTPWTHAHHGCAVQHTSAATLQSCPAFKRAVREAVRTDPEYRAQREALEVEMREKSRAMIADLEARGIVRRRR